jgi:cytochrome c biogenesis protein CcdA
VQLSGIPAGSLRIVSVFIIAGLGISMLIPQFQLLTEKLFSRLTSLVPRTKTQPGFVAGVIVGLSLGLLWTPCVGPILASVIALAITGTVSLNAVLITLAYALGTAIPMLLIMIGGRTLLNKVPWVLQYPRHTQEL